MPACSAPRRPPSSRPSGALGRLRASAPQTPSFASIPPATLTTCPTRGRPRADRLTQNLSTTGDAVVTHLLAVEADGGGLRRRYRGTSSPRPAISRPRATGVSCAMPRHTAAPRRPRRSPPGHQLPRRGLFFLDPLDLEVRAWWRRSITTTSLAWPRVPRATSGPWDTTGSSRLRPLQPTAPTVLATHDTGGSAWTLMVRTLAYIGHDSGRLSVVDLTRPTDPPPRRHRPPQRDPRPHDLRRPSLRRPGHGRPRDLVPVRPQRPHLGGPLPLPPPVLSLDARDHTLWATNHAGVLVLDLDDPAQPTLKGRGAHGAVVDVVAHDGGAIVADWQRLLLDDAPDLRPSWSPPTRCSSPTRPPSPSPTSAPPCWP